MPTLQDGRRSINVTANKTITDAESGQVMDVKKDAVAITLPSNAAGKVVRLRVGGEVATTRPAGAVQNKSTGFTVVGTVCGLGTASGTLSCVKGTANQGDEIELISGGAIWYVGRCTGAGWAVA